MNREDINNTWAAYFDQLLNYGEWQNPLIFEQKKLNMVEHFESPIEEIKRQVKSLKSYRRG